MHLEPVLRPELTRILIDCSDRESMLQDAAQLGASALEGVTPEQILGAIEEREKSYPTETPEGVAFPHCLLPSLGATLVVACLLKPGVRWSKSDAPLQDLVFVMIGNEDKPWEHVRILARLARIARGPGALDRIRSSQSDEELFEALVSEDRSHA